MDGLPVLPQENQGFGLTCQYDLNHISGIGVLPGASRLPYHFFDGTKIPIAVKFHKIPIPVILHGF